jgi:hypothetical protein
LLDRSSFDYLLINLFTNFSLKIQIASFKIIFIVRLSDSNFALDSSFLNSMIKARDVYNIKTQMRRDELEFMTSVQALMHELDVENWTFFFRKDRLNQITHLFFFKESSQKILKVNYEVLIINCTYKTNKYKMFLMIIFDQIALHKIFYVAFCFMTKEKQNDYVWVMKQLKDLCIVILLKIVNERKALYHQLNLSYSTVFVTNMKRDLINDCRLIFSSINHSLCIWHINNNVLINCKKRFFIKEAWDAFSFEWKSIMYADSKQEYRQLWDKFVDRYNLSHEECIDYLYETYIRDYRCRFIKCYINQVLHFDTTVPSRDEKEHAVLKRQLESSTNDLKTVMNDINLLLINEQHNYLIDMIETKMRYSIELRRSVFDQLTSFVTSVALWKILSQYKKLIERFTVISACIDVFITTTELSCSHKIQKRLFNENCILIENVHSHWR